jgi:hypothetical protein
MRKVFLVILLFSAGISVFSQEEKLSLQIDSIQFRELADTLEKVFPVRFYYDEKWIDSLVVSVSADALPLDKILENTLAGEGLSYFITYDNRVIITKDYSLRTSFGRDYLEYLKKERLRTETTSDYTLLLKPEESTVSDESRIFRIGNRSEAGKGGNAILSGTISSISDGEPIPGAIVYVGKLRAGAMTNDYGHYSITLPKGQYQIEYRMIGFKTTKRNVIMSSDGVLDVSLADQNVIEPVIITGTRDNIKDIRTGIEQISVKMMKQIPMGLGEVDIIRSTLQLPGVQSVGEASAGFNVRGGSTDQNLVLLNDAPVMNTSHLFGFFSAFNQDLAADVTLYKSGMPAKYGGRLSSVMIINPAEGNDEKIKVSGGVSPVAGRILVEGPIFDDKTRFIIGARTTYSDWLLGKLDDYKISNSSARFYDLQGSVSHQFSEKNTFTLSGYLSDDRFNYYSESSFNYGNFATTLKWDHDFNANLSVRISAIISDYKYSVDTYDDSTNYSSLTYKLDQKIIRSDFQYSKFEKHKLEFGLDATYFTLQPGIREPFGEYSVVREQELDKEHAVEPSLYFSDEFDVTPLLSLSAGVRGTFYTSFGPGTEFRYSNAEELSVTSISDTVRFKAGEIMSFYPRLELRLSARLSLTPQSSIKFNTQRAFQYIHMITNTTSISPTDIWKLSNRYIKPERSDQVSMGYYYNFRRKGIETSIETYYKKLDNILDYKGGAVLIMNQHLETEIVDAEGKAFGIELMVKKQAGRVTGWVSYTWSRTLLRAKGEYASRMTYGGSYYPADFDKPNDLSLVTNIKLSRRFNFTTNFNYSTGRPITYPVAFFYFNNTNQLYYSYRNSYRMPDYIRLDMAVTVNGNLKFKKLNHSSLTFSVYNVLGRRNPYSIYFRNEGGVVKGYQLSIFGQPVMMLTYNFKILGNASGDF